MAGVEIDPVLAKFAGGFILWFLMVWTIFQVADVDDNQGGGGGWMPGG